MSSRAALAAAMIWIASAGFDAAAAESVHAVAKLMQIDEANGEVTLYHGALEALDLKAGNTAFRLRGVAIPKGLTHGDNVMFDARRIDGAPTITSMEKFEGEFDDHAH